ncbi:MAG: hypothetical protein ICV60_01000 [Pyrinomonadaceae bacterium]|nr:hypothetical protein [Pyrinomonadaceae bacterium]
MRKLMLAIMLTAVCAVAAFAQVETRGGAQAASGASLSRSDKSLNIESGTRLAAELESTLDARKARVGDRVVLRTTEAIKENGRTVVKKGARLIGRVTDVQQRGRGRGESSVSLLFDRLDSGSLSTPITATINSITQARARGNYEDGRMSTDADVRSSSSARTGSSQQRSGGGVLGGVTNTVGGVLDTTTQTVGGTVNAAGQTVGNTVGNVSNTVGSIRIEQSSSADVQGGTTLSLAGDNLRLEKGATFHLTLNQSAGVRGNQ